MRFKLRSEGKGGGGVGVVLQAEGTRAKALKWETAEGI